MAAKDTLSLSLALLLSFFEQRWLIIDGLPALRSDLHWFLRTFWSFQNLTGGPFPAKEVGASYSLARADLGDDEWSGIVWLWRTLIEISREEEGQVET